MATMPCRIVSLISCDALLLVISTTVSQKLLIGETRLQQEQGVGKLHTLQARLDSLRPWFDEYQKYVNLLRHGKSCDTLPARKRHSLCEGGRINVFSCARYEKSKAEHHEAAALNSDKTTTLMSEQEKHIRAQLKDIDADIKVTFISICAGSIAYQPTS